MFAHDLFAALSKYAVRHGFRVKPLSVQSGHVTAKVTGQGVWQRLHPEIGTHCVQRVPPTETKGRRHTSYLGVAVFPVLNKTFAPLPASEIDVQTQGGSGPGGQHQNMRDSAVRMLHVPTGIKVFINGRCQHTNRHEALRILTARVRDHEQQLADAEYRKLRSEQLGNVGRGQKIRTYNYLNDRAVDHRTGAKTKVRRVIEKGAFELLE